MTKQQRVAAALAEYFTGHRVSHHSIGLQVGGKMGEEAAAFFRIRAALGVQGYPTADEAAKMITRAWAPDEV